MEKRINIDAKSWSEVENIIKDVYCDEIELIQEEELTQLFSSAHGGNEILIDTNGDMNMPYSEILALLQTAIGAIGLLFSYFKIEHHKKQIPNIDYVDIFISDAAVTKSMSKKMILELIERKAEINEAIRRHNTFYN